jgi:hypothetical protein
MIDYLIISLQMQMNNSKITNKLSIFMNKNFIFTHSFKHYGNI